MKIGFSLPVTYLSGSLSAEGDELWSDIFGPPEDSLKQLRDLGVTSIEINKVGPAIRAEQIREAVENVLSNDLAVTVHGWLPSSINDDVFLRITNELNVLFKDSPPQSIPLIVHGHKVLQTTLATLDWYTKRLNKQGSPLVLALEICRAKEGGPVGRTYEEIFSIVEQTGFTKMGICWDLGHTQANYFTRQQERAYPDLDFSKKVIHTHIHDIGTGGRTHFPITSNHGYVANGVHMLNNVGYRGVFNLELYPIRWRMSAEQCGRLLETSITTLSSLASKPD